MVWYASLDIDLTNFNQNNYHDLEGLEERYTRGYNQVLISMSKLVLFINQEDLLFSVYDLNDKTYELQKFNLYNIQRIISGHKLKKRLEEDSNDNKSKLEQDQMNSLLELADYHISSSVKKHVEETPSYYRKIIESRKRFIETAKEYIRKGLE